MTQQTAKPSSINTSTRCTHRFANGKRCRLYATFANPSFCPSHADLQHHRPDPAETAATLSANLDDFTSPAQINDFLSRLLLLLAHDKISTRRAAVLTYIVSQLLRTISAIQKEENAEPRHIIFDAPRPDRSGEATSPNPTGDEQSAKAQS